MLRVVINRPYFSNPMARIAASLVTVIIALIITAVILLFILPLIGITIAIVAGFIVFVISGIFLSSIISHLFKRDPERKKFNRLKNPKNTA